MPGEPTLMRGLITVRHWQKFTTFEAQFRRAAAQLAAEHDEPDLKRVTVSARQFERWYAGKVKTAPHPDACRILEHMFGYPVHELLGSASQVTQRSEEKRLAERGLPQAFANDAPEESGVAFQYKFQYNENFDCGNPLSACGDSTLSDPEGVIAMAARRAMRFGASADASNVGPESLGLLRAEIGRLAAAYPQQPLPALIGDIVSLQDHSFTLLEGRQRPRETRDLYVIGGLASGMLAKAAHDFSDPYMAMTHARTAMLCAKNAEHPALIAWIHGLQSLITYWADRPRDALQYAQSGINLPETHGTVKVWLASLEARAWSALGNVSESQRSIETASELREHVTGDDLDELGGICNFSRARQLYYAADAGALLLPESWAEAGDPENPIRQTESYALEAIAAYENAPSGDKSFSDEAGARTDLAIARIRANNLDGAIEAVDPVLNLPVEQRIRGVIISVVNVHRAITATAPGEIITRQLQEEIENYCRTPVAALRS